jgi:hypothetical protein
MRYMFKNLEGTRIKKIDKPQKLASLDTQHHYAQTNANNVNKV